MRRALRFIAVACLAGSRIAAAQLTRYKPMRSKVVKSRTIGCLFAIIFIAGCVSSPVKDSTLSSGFYPDASEDRKTSWKLLVGSWYGSQKTDDGGTYSWIVRRNVNGLYRLEGKIVNSAGVVKNQVEVGEWGAGNGIYFSIFKGWLRGNDFSPSDPSDPYNRDIYKILELTEEVFKYEHLDNGESFTVRRVEDDFQMPEEERGQI